MIEPFQDLVVKVEAEPDTRRKIWIVRDYDEKRKGTKKQQIAELTALVEAQAKEAKDAMDFMGIPLESHDCLPGGIAICCRLAKIASKPPSQPRRRGIEMNDACVCVDVDDAAEVTWEQTPVARKEHKCCECGEVIRVGEQYEKTSMVFEGDFSTHKTCGICVKIRTEYFKCGWYFGQMYEELAEAWGTTRELLLTGMEPAAPEGD